MKRFLLSMTLVLLAMPFGAARAEPTSSAVADRAEVVKGNNAFAVELYGQLRTQPGNLFFSPESISTALAITYAGAKGETAAEMARVLHITLPRERLHPAMSALLNYRNASHTGYQLKEAASLWGQSGYSFQPEFLALCGHSGFLSEFFSLKKDSYEVRFNTVDFKGATETARRTINQWVEQHTENTIKELLQLGMLKPETRLVLTNAIYFKGNWETPFNRDETKGGDFHISATQTVKVLMMHGTGKFNYLDSDSFQALEIPYEQKELSIVIMLPKSMDGLSAFEKSLEGIQLWLGLMNPVENVILTMPKFKIEEPIELKGYLGAMGMKQAFDGKTADFSGMAPKEEMQKNGNLYIDAVIHKSFVDVNEEGTEAAAATAVAAPGTALAPSALPVIPIFRADHPFLFLIRDNRSGSILFMGRVTDPTK